MDSLGTRTTKTSPADGSECNAAARSSALVVGSKREAPIIGQEVASSSDSWRERYTSAVDNSPDARMSICCTSYCHGTEVLTTLRSGHVRESGIECRRLRFVIASSVLLFLVHDV